MCIIVSKASRLFRVGRFFNTLTDSSTFLNCWVMIYSFFERFSESSDSIDPLHPSTPGRQTSDRVFSPLNARPSDSLAPTDSNLPSTPGSKSLPPIFDKTKKSEDEELEAVEALLSIKQSYPLLPSTSTSAEIDEIGSEKTVNYFIFISSSV